MQYFPKDKAVTVLVFLSVILFAVMLLVTPNAITNVSAVETYDVKVYWDSICEVECKNISWGTLEPGSVRSKIVYIRNEVEEPVYLIMNTTHWYPGERAREYITLKWDYTYRRIDPDEVLQVELRLSVSSSITEISNFSFDIYIGGQRLLGDVNGDGRVSSSDLVLVVINLGKSSKESPGSDVNGDGNVSSSDLILVIINLGAGS